MRLSLHVFVPLLLVILVSCDSGVPLTLTPTLPGPIVPTRIIPTIASTSSPTPESTEVVVAPTNTELPPTSPATLTPSELPTEAPTWTPSATLTPTETDTPLPSDTPTPATPIAQAVRDLVLRGGPGSQYPAVATLAADESLDITGISEDGSWFQVRLADSSIAWLSAAPAFVDTSGNLNAVPVALAPTETDTPTPTASDTPTETYTPSNTPTDTLTPTPTPNYRGTAQAEATAQAAQTQTAIAESWTDTPTPTLTFTPSDTPTDTPTPTLTPSDTPTSTLTPSDTPTDTLTPSPTPTATLTPSLTPTLTPTETHSFTPSPAPTDTPKPTPISRAPALDNPSGVLTAGTTVTNRIDDLQYAVIYRYEGEQNSIISVAMTRASGDLDPFLIVLDPDGRMLTRNDDQSASMYDSAIGGLRLPQTGAYTIIATRYMQRFGSSSGDFSLLVRLEPDDTRATASLTVPIEYNVLDSGVIDNTNFEQLYTFQGSRGDIISIQLTNQSGDLDPSLYLLDNFGSMIARNDDDVATQTTNASLRSVQLPADGSYTIVATRYQGASGTSTGQYRLKLALEQAGTPGVYPLRYGIMDPGNSGVMRADGQLFADYAAGDRLDTENREFTSQTVFTFLLPSLEPGETVESAALEMGACQEIGLGWAGLGALTVYADPFGRHLPVESMLQPSAQAQVITTLTACQPVDVTAAVSAAYQNGESYVQFRLMFANTVTMGNNQRDEIVFGDPRLAVNVR